MIKACERCGATIDMPSVCITHPNSIPLEDKDSSVLYFYLDSQGDFRRRMLRYVCDECWAFTLGMAANLIDNGRKVRR